MLNRKRSERVSRKHYCLPGVALFALPKVGSNGHRLCPSPGIQAPSQRTEIHKYARSCCCGDVNGMETWKSPISKRRTRRSGLADWRDSSAPTT